MTSGVRHDLRNPVSSAAAAMSAGRPVLVIDDVARENETAVVLAAQSATPEWLAWMVRQTSGLVCAPMTGERADLLELPPMVRNNEDSLETAYTVTVDARDGIGTGVNAADRARTLRVLADPATEAGDLTRPGHILPLRARPGGITERPGHTEASVELCALAGLARVAAIAELTEDDGTVTRHAQALDLGRRFELPVVTTAQLITYRQAHPPATRDASPPTERISRGPETVLYTRYGRLRTVGYRDRRTGAEHLALIGGRPHDGAIVRVHSECLTGEALGSLRCDCGPQLGGALSSIAADGGLLIYLRGHEGRGIGLLPKLAAYRLQDGGLDTVEANLELGVPADNREYGAAAAILHDLGLSRIDLLTNNPAKVAGMREAGIQVQRRVPLRVPGNLYNLAYLNAKQAKLGHLLG